MNQERIRELAEEADIQFYKSYVPETGFKYEGAEVTVEDLEKFAELIVRQCLFIIDDERKSDMVNRTELWKQIKQHFGVQ